MLAGQLALVLAAVFAGAAFYVGFAEHPARMTLDGRDALAQMEGKPSYHAGYLMQASLAGVWRAARLMGKTARRPDAAGRGRDPGLSLGAELSSAWRCF